VKLPSFEPIAVSTVTPINIVQTEEPVAAAVTAAPTPEVSVEPKAEAPSAEPAAPADPLAID